MSDHRDKPRRHQTATERDVQGMAARRERAASAPVYVDEEVTGRYEGAELEQHRAGRPPDVRFAHIERKHDELAAAVTVIAVAQGTLTGKIDTLVDFAAASAVEREKRAAAEAAERESKRKHIVPIIKSIGVALALIAAALIGRG